MNLQGEYKMLNLQNGVDQWCDLAQLLNNEIKSSGAISINNKRIWAKLHPLTDQDWSDILVTFGQFNADHGEYVDMNEYKTWQEAVEQFEKYCGVLRGDAPGYSCMDYKDRNKHKSGFSTKGKTWAFMMRLREVYCKIGNLNIPNR
jgi:hypothetical protein